MHQNNRMKLYQTWAPAESPWSAWAKPVLFASMPRVIRNVNAAARVQRVQLSPEPGTMVIADLPGSQGVAEALGFAEAGWRPVPLYNGVMGGRNMLVNVNALAEALYLGAELLRDMPLRADAPPVFLLDAKRMNGSKAPDTFDNRWCVFPQDMPSAQCLNARGITKIVVRAARVETDLSRVLYEYQNKGIALYLLREHDEEPQPLRVKRQGFAEEWAYRLKVTLGLKRNAAGGFGGKIPAAYEQAGSGAHYRMG